MIYYFIRYDSVSGKIVKSFLVFCSCSYSSFLKILLPDLLDSDQFEFRNSNTIAFPAKLNTLFAFCCGSRFSIQLFLNVLIPVVLVLCTSICVQVIH